MVKIRVTVEYELEIHYEKGMLDAGQNDLRPIRIDHLEVVESDLPGNVGIRDIQEFADEYFLGRTSKGEQV